MSKSTSASTPSNQPEPYEEKESLSLLEQSLWWLLPYACLMLFMVFAMMQFTAALLIRPPRADGEPVDLVDAAELRRRLKGLTENERGLPYDLAEGKDCDLELQWQPVDPLWSARFDRVKLTLEGCSWRLGDIVDGRPHRLDQEN